MSNQVIFVPGFTGSLLYLPNKTLPDETIWINRVKLLVDGPGDLELAADGVGPGPLAQGALSVGHAANPGWYDALLAQLVRDGWNVDVWWYDWRLDARANGAALGRYLASTYAGKKIYVLGYSLGGLLAKYAFPVYAALTTPTNWVRTVYLGTPFGGSCCAPQNLAALNVPQTWTFYLGLLVGQFAALIRSPFSLSAGIRQEMAQVVASWPVMYDLLPSTQGPWATLDPNAGIFWQLGSYTAASNPYVTQPRLTAAASNQAYLASLLTASSPFEVCVLANGILTPNHLTQSAVGQQSSYGYGYSGDGLVDFSRGTLPTAQLVFFNGDHFSIVQNSAILSQLTNWLLNGVNAIMLQAG